MYWLFRCPWLLACKTLASSHTEAFTWASNYSHVQAWSRGHVSLECPSLLLPRWLGKCMEHVWWAGPRTPSPYSKRWPSVRCCCWSKGNPSKRLSWERWVYSLITKRFDVAPLSCGGRLPFNWHSIYHWMIVHIVVSLHHAYQSYHTNSDGLWRKLLLCRLVITFIFFNLLACAFTQLDSVL